MKILKDYKLPLFPSDVCERASCVATSAVLSSTQLTLLVMLVTTALQWLAADSARLGPFVFYYPGLVVCALYGSAPLAVALALVLANLFFMPESPFVSPDVLVLNLMFLAAGLLIWRLAAQFRNALTQLRAEKQRVENSQAVLKASEAYFRTLVDESPGILWLTDETGSCTYLSKKWYEVTDQDPATCFPFGWLDAIHTEDRHRVEETFLKSASTRTKFTAEYRIKTKAGDYRWVHDSGHPRFSKNDEYLGFIGTVVDANEQKEAEQDLQRAVLARDQFLSLASHELKTPLTALKLQVQIRQRLWERGNHETFAIDKIPDLLKADTRQIDRLSFLIDDLLDISRITTGRFDMHRETFDLSELVTQSAQRLVRQLLAAQCELQMEAATNIVGEFDRERIRQVLLSLIVNATRFGEGKPVGVCVRRVGEDAVVEIRDHGKGIAKEDHEKIFERFERSLSSREIGGLGLGLFVAREIAHAHGGSLTVISELGNGSTFRLTLPLRTPPPDITRQNHSESDIDPPSH